MNFLVLVDVINNLELKVVIYYVVILSFVLKTNNNTMETSKSQNNIYCFLALLNQRHVKLVFNF